MAHSRRHGPRLEEKVEKGRNQESREHSIGSVERGYSLARAHYYSHHHVLDSGWSLGPVSRPWLNLPLTKSPAPSGPQTDASWGASLKFYHHSFPATQYFPPVR